MNPRMIGWTVKLFASLARDRSLSRKVRLPLWLVVPYLACPFDLIPDFIPVIGHADDVLIVVWALRSVVKRAGWESVENNWSGTPAGLASLRKVVRL